MAADPSTHPAVRRVRDQLARLGVRGQVRVLDDAARTAAQAAAALGVEVGQIASSLVFHTARPVSDTGSETAARSDTPGCDTPGCDTPGCDHEHATTIALLVLTSGAHRVDVVKVADLLGVPGLARPDADGVRAATGFAIGGVAPVGHPQPLRTIVDVALSRYDVVWAAAGHPHAVFPTTYDELLRITGGQAAEVA